MVAWVLCTSRSSGPAKGCGTRGKLCAGSRGPPVCFRDICACRVLVYDIYTCCRHRLFVFVYKF